MMTETDKCGRRVYGTEGYPKKSFRSCLLGGRCWRSMGRCQRLRWRRWDMWPRACGPYDCGRRVVVLILMTVITMRRWVWRKWIVELEDCWRRRWLWMLVGVWCVGSTSTGPNATVRRPSSHHPVTMVGMAVAVLLMHFRPRGSTLNKNSSQDSPIFFFFSCVRKSFL